MTRAAIVALVFVLGAAAQAEVPVYRWGQTFGGSDDDRVSDIAVDDAGNLYATGAIEGDVDVDGDGRIDVSTDGGGRALYVAKYRPGDHQLVWIDYLRGELSYGRGIAVDPNGESIYVVGAFRRLVSFNPLWGQPARSCWCPIASSRAGLVIAYNGDGQAQWVDVLDGTGTNPQSVAEAQDI